MTTQKKDFNDIKQMLTEMSENASLVRTDPELFNHPSNILYRLPLTHQQRETLYHNIMNEYNAKKALNKSIQEYKLSALNSITDHVSTTEKTNA